MKIKLRTICLCWYLISLYLYWIQYLIFWQENWKLFRWPKNIEKTDKQSYDANYCILILFTFSDFVLFCFFKKSKHITWKVPIKLLLVHNVAALPRWNAPPSLMSWKSRFLRPNQFQICRLKMVYVWLTTYVHFTKCVGT